MFPETTIDENTIISNNIIHTKEQVLELVHKLAAKKDIQPEDLFIVRESFDKLRNLLALTVAVAPRKARELDCEFMHYKYMLTDKNSGNDGDRSKKSSIYALYDIEDRKKTRVEWVAYCDAVGNWLLDPHNLILDPTNTPQNP